MRAHRSRLRWRKRRFVREKRTPIWFHLLPAWRPRHFKDETLSLCHPERERRISVQREILRCAQDDTAASASFDWQHVFFSWNCVTTFIVQGAPLGAWAI